MKKILRIITLCFMLAIALSVAPSSYAHAKSTPTWPFGSGCSAKEVGKTKSNGSQVCIKQGNTNKWVKTLTTEDVYGLAPFCLMTISSKYNGEVCEWNENIGLQLVKRNVPRDLCIGAIRKVVFLETRYYLPSANYIDTSNLLSQVYKILADQGCFKSK